MNRKGQIGLGTIMIVFITIIVGVILFQVIAQETGKSTNTVTLSNQSLATVTNGTTQYLSYRALSDVVVFNATGDVEILSGNFTVENNVINPTTGDLAVAFTPTIDDSNINDNYTSGGWLLSATAQPTTYIAESGARSVTTLIAIFFALAIAFVALTPTLRSEILSMMGR